MDTTKYSRKLTPPRIIALLASPLAVVACASVRYPSLGVDGIDSENAPYVIQRVLSFEDEVQVLARDTWTQAIQVPLANTQPECGEATYQVPAEGETAAQSPNDIVTDGVVTVNRHDCETGDAVDSMSITFETGSDGSAPTVDQFTARVEYVAVRPHGLSVDAVFNVEFGSQGATDPLAQDFDAAGWRIVPATDGRFVISSSNDDHASIEEFRFQFVESHTEWASLAMRDCKFVLRDGETGTPLTVSTPTSIKKHIETSQSQRPYEGVVRVRDVDDIETVLDLSPLTSDLMLLRTYDLHQSDEQVQANVTWDDLESAEAPQGMNGWL